MTVLPITHSRPHDPASAVEIPLPVKRHLGLDDDPSWIIVDEGNEFFWPGYDLRKLPHRDRYDYGFLPPRFFNQVLGPLWTGIEADGSSLLRVDNMTPVSQTHAARNHISNVTKPGLDEAGPGHSSSTAVWVTRPLSCCHRWSW